MHGTATWSQWRKRKLNESDTEIIATQVQASGPAMFSFFMWWQIAKLTMTVSKLHKNTLHNAYSYLYILNFIFMWQGSMKNIVPSLLPTLHVNATKCHPSNLIKTCS